MRGWIGEIEIDFAADNILDHHVLAWRTKAQSALVFENVARLLKLFQVTFVKLGALALKIRAEIASDVRSFIQVQAKPCKALVTRRGRFLVVPFNVGIFDAQNELSVVMPREKPVKKRRARPADVQIAGRRGSETNTDI